MENVKPAARAPAAEKKWDGFSAFLILAAIGIAVFSGVLGWKKHNLNREIFEIQNSIGRVEAQIQTIKQADNVDDKQRANEILQRAETYRIRWSTLINAILRYESSDIRFLELGSTPEGEVKISGRATSISNLTQFLEKMKTDVNAHQPFVPTISAEKNSDWIDFSLRFIINLPQ
ncbi:hypothetical protein HN954_05095 [bacterium]|jgi:hypothetical protein|nr:hypothetical protein [bacterium]MBT6832325.1 hypothetical protein [bacterium]MBT6996770.1 hypothetical protein [bacterium]MBT7772817.1 hypothetical protein [bacterium]